MRNYTQTVISQDNRFQEFKNLVNSIFERALVEGMTSIKQHATATEWSPAQAFADKALQTALSSKVEKN